MASPYKWGQQAQTTCVSTFHTRVRELVQERLAQSGRTWEEAVFDPSLDLTQQDFAQIDAELLDTGYRYDYSARISVQEAPEKYKADVEAPEAGELERDAEGRALVGEGDNVFRVAEDVIGTARFISSTETVMDMLVDGVPENTVAIIDDSGGTLTAPILEGFSAVVCKGGTIRSHLGILTREYNIPCLMRSELSGLSDGDRVQVEYTADPVSAYAKESVRARVWKLD